MKKFYTFLLLALCAGGMAAQQESGGLSGQSGQDGVEAVPFNPKWAVGVGLSANFNFHDGGTAFMKDVEYNPFMGAGFSINATYRLYKWLAFRTGAIIMMKNYQWSNTVVINENSVTLTTLNLNNYVNFPVMADLSIGKKVRWHLFLGAYAGYWSRGHRLGVAIPLIVVDEAIVDEEYAFDSRRDNRFDAGLVYGIGMSIPCSKRIEIDIEALTHYGLTDVQKKYMRQQNARYNTTTMLQLGVAYNF